MIPSKDADSSEDHGDGVEETVNQVDAKSVQSGGNMCRICFSEEQDEVDNPLISPCKCAGSMASVHLGCLR